MDSLKPVVTQMTLIKLKGSHTKRKVMNLGKGQVGRKGELIKMEGR